MDLITLQALLHTAYLKVRLQVQDIVNASVDEAKEEIRGKTLSANINDYVKYEENFLPDGNSVETIALTADLDHLGLHHKSNSGTANSAPATAWVTNCNKPYSWSSRKGKVVNEPLPLSEYESIKNIMDKINNDYNLCLDSCLVMYYPDNYASVKLHSDDEDSLDHSQPICTVSVGATRQVEFLNQLQQSTSQPVLTINAKSGSLYQMLPDCQTFLSIELEKWPNLNMSVLDIACHSEKWPVMVIIPSPVLLRSKH